MRVQCTGQVLRIEIEMPDGKVWPFAFNALAAAELERIHPGALDAVQRAKKERGFWWRRRSGTGPLGSGYFMTCWPPGSGPG